MKLYLIAPMVMHLRFKYSGISINYINEFILSFGVKVFLFSLCYFQKRNSRETRISFL